MFLAKFMRVNRLYFGRGFFTFGYLIYLFIYLNMAKKRTYFTLKDLVSFGEYLLSERRENMVLSHPTLKGEERLRDVSDADIANWKDSCSQQPTPGK